MNSFMEHHHCGNIYLKINLKAKKEKPLSVVSREWCPRVLFLGGAIEPLIFHSSLIFGTVHLDTLDAMSFTDPKIPHHDIPLINDFVRNFFAIETRGSDVEVGTDQVFPGYLVVLEDIDIKILPVLQRQEEPIDALADEVTDTDERHAASSGVDTNGEEHIDPRTGTTQ